MTWKFHVCNSDKGSYNIILGRNLLTTLGLDLKSFDSGIVGGDGPHEGCLAPMFDISNYDYKTLTDKIVKPEESFLNSCVNECFESEKRISQTRKMRIILDTKYKKGRPK